MRHDETIPLNLAATLDMNSDYTPMKTHVGKLIYLDYNCFQRSFDDQQQTRIRMETAACEEILSSAAAGRIELAWSFMHEDENALCPFLERKTEVRKLSELCKVQIPPHQEIKRKAEELQKEYKLHSKDALHLGCAMHGHVDIFVTCDDAVKRKTGGQIGTLVITNPVQLVIGER